MEIATKIETIRADSKGKKTPGMYMFVILFEPQFTADVKDFLMPIVAA